MSGQIGGSLTPSNDENIPNFSLPAPVPRTAPTFSPARADTVQASATQAGVTNARAGQATTREWTPTQRTVNADTETVQGQLRSVLDAGGPLMERAVARSNEMWNARGLLNSSMANTAALDALLGQALQIAGQDAQTYSTAARDNWMVANQAGQFNANEFNEMSRFNVAEGNQTERFNASEANQTSRFNANEMNQIARQNAAEANQTNRYNAEAANAMLGREQQAALERDRMREATALEAARANQNARLQAAHARLAAQLETASRERLMAIEQNYRTLTNSSAQAATVVFQMQQEIGRILSDPNIAAGNKQWLIDRLIQNASSALRTIGAINGVNYGNLLNFGSPIRIPPPLVKGGPVSVSPPLVKGGPVSVSPPLVKGGPVSVSPPLVKGGPVSVGPTLV